MDGIYLSMQLDWLVATRSLLLIVWPNLFCQKLVLTAVKEEINGLLDYQIRRL